jgi:SpoVK/Ycf46/Vps4 family AAA+-type ATPase
LLNVALNALLNYVIQVDKQLIVTSMGCAPAHVEQRACAATVPKFEPEDYAFLCQRMLLPGAAERLYYAKIHRYAANLNAYQLHFACTWLTRYNRVDTEQFITYLREHHLASNVDLQEVQPVDIRDLKGVDDILQSLEANIVIPLENDELAQELNLRPKRGVLLAGPPGTGKTTIGRALAHRLKSKFFLIDGTVVAGTAEFYVRIQQIFQAAQQNAPCVVFIDDTDVIFEQGEEFGLYRYLLTMLDGLESESNSQVCVMMTAMNIGNLPPALVRSGRIELWLETRLPDGDARREILCTHVLGLPEALGAIDVERLATATDGLTGADIKRLAEDAKTLYAYDRVHGLPYRSATDYFLTATETVRKNKAHYAQAVEQIRHNLRRARRAGA